MGLGEVDEPFVDDEPFDDFSEDTLESAARQWAAPLSGQFGQFGEPCDVRTLNAGQESAAF
jgi:hypothetical protein